VFSFEQTGIDEHGAAVGEFHATGIQPRSLARLRATGCDLPPAMFERRILRTERTDEFTQARSPR
jgi:pilus assembly protein CpaF